MIFHLRFNSNHRISCEFSRLDGDLQGLDLRGRKKRNEDEKVKSSTAGIRKLVEREAKKAGDKWRGKKWRKKRGKKGRARYGPAVLHPINRSTE